MTDFTPGKWIVDQQNQTLEVTDLKLQFNEDNFSGACAVTYDHHMGNELLICLPATRDPTDPTNPHVVYKNVETVSLMDDSIKPKLSLWTNKLKQLWNS